MIDCSKRLKAIIQCIDQPIIADVGCDHAYVAVEAILESRVEKAYACDISQGPLQRAQKTIEQYDVMQQVHCILMNGIESLPEDVKEIIIAGMGASTIVEILKQGKVKENQTLLLSPHKDAPFLRKYLMEQDYEILEEGLVQEDLHFYPILKVKRGKQTLTLAEIYYGYQVHKNADYSHFIHYEWKKWNQLIRRIPENQQQEAKERLQSLEEILKKL